MGRRLRLVARRAGAQAGGRPGGPGQRAGRGRGDPARRSPTAACAAPTGARRWPRPRPCAPTAPGARARRGGPRPGGGRGRCERATSRPERRALRRCSRWTSTASARGSAPGTSSSRAPSAGFAGVAGAAARARRARLRRRLPAADPPDRRHPPQGAQQRPHRARRAIPAARGRSARAEGGHTAVNPELGTLADFESLVAAARDARHRDRARLRDPVLARPPLARRAPGVVPPPPRRHAEVRREPAQALPGHLQRQLRHATTGAALWDALRDARASFWVRARACAIFRVDNPHTKPIPLLGVADPRRCAPSTPTSSSWPRPSRSPAPMYALAKVGFSQSYTYFTWKNSAAELVEYVVELAGAVVGVLPAELLRQHARHPPRVPPGRRARRPSRRGSSWRPPSRRATASTRASRTCENVPVRAGQRGVPRLREVRGQGAPRSTGRCCRWCAA